MADDLAEHEIQREHRDAVDEQNQDLMASAHLDAIYAVGDGLAASLEKKKKKKNIYKWPWFKRVVDKNGIIDDLV